MYVFLANAVLGLHVLLVLFVVLTVPLVFLGGFFKWDLVRNLWLRLSHLVCILIVTAQAWLGVVCPLTTLEMWLRKKGNLETYSESFIEYWMQEFLYWDLPVWMFVLVYTVFTTLVIMTWVIIPPKKALI